MDLWPQRHIDGFEVKCEVVSLDAGVLAIEIAVSRPGDAEFQPVSYTHLTLPTTPYV